VGVGFLILLLATLGLYEPAVLLLAPVAVVFLVVRWVFRRLGAWDG
jgi:hypothetical protein